MTIHLILFENHIGLRLIAKIDIRVHTDRPALINFLLFVRMRKTSQTSVSNFSQKIPFFARILP